MLFDILLAVVDEPMEIKPFDDLKPNPKNPRRISEFDFENLKKSILQFGDLSGIVFNITTQQLVGGHQRIEAFKRLGGEKRVTYQQQFYDQPNKVGTVAFGHVVLDNEFYPYREVQWTAEREAAANIAANRIQGEFDLDLLAEANYQLHQEFPDLLELTGQSKDEIDNLLASTGAGDDSDSKPPNEPSLTLKIKCDDDQQMSDLYKELTERGLKVKI